jgi:hypothetical protein
MVNGTFPGGRHRENIAGLARPGRRFLPRATEAFLSSD